MLKKYKNEVYQIIKDKFSLDTNRFTISNFREKQNPVTEIKIKDSEMCFQFYNFLDSWDKFKFRYTGFMPVISISELIPKSLESMDKATTFHHFENWIKNHVKPFLEEIDSTDPWSDFQFEQNIFSLLDVNPLDNSPFTRQQIQFIADSTNVLKELIIDRFNPVETQLQYITERLDYIAHATERLGKFDWYGIFLSSLISIAINMGVDTETPKAIYELVKQAFSSFKMLLN